MFPLLLLSLTAFSAGLAGSAHCIGMCGGIGTTLGLHAQHKRYIFSYHAGRLLSYSALGLIAGNLLSLLGVHRYAQLPLRHLPNAMVVLTGIFMWFEQPPLRFLERHWARLWQPIGRHIQQFLPIKRHSDALLLGLAWGLLPCGLIYSALMLAISSGNTFSAAWVMCCFGLGTLPAMLSLSVLARYGRLYLQHRWLKRALGIGLIGLGLWQYSH